MLQSGGESDPALEACRRAAATASAADVRSNALYSIACVHALQGRTQDALRSLEEAVASGFKDRATLLADPDLATLRSEARFKKLVATTGS